MEYVIACAIDQRKEHLPGPLLIDGDKPVQFNPEFDICSDCDDRHSAQMAHKGKCQPQYLIRLFAPKAEPAPKVSKESA